MDINIGEPTITQYSITVGAQTEILLEIMEGQMWVYGHLMSLIL